MDNQGGAKIGRREEEKESPNMEGLLKVAATPHLSASKEKVDPYLRDVRILLRDNNPDIVQSWRSYWLDEENEKGFGGLPNASREVIQNVIDISKGDIFMRDNELIVADAIVSPGNSFGFMDGGIDLVYSRRFGWQLMERLQDVIKDKYAGELLVGQAAIIETKDPKETIKYLISAPTMRVPTDVRGTVNAYLAFRATLLAVRKHNKKVMEGTAVGLMNCDACAYQMLKAYEAVVFGNLFPFSDLAGFQFAHHQMATHTKA